ncbi:protein RRNAD1 [Oryzias melastigma]|uniref:Methyltransferase like 25B n=1 Tax=Oryzias melastigma TaxID=30732 RepID=A0A3B3CRM2_ORYME|nr:protein RRNAD1 [Oryzias melastigma]
MICLMSLEPSAGQDEGKFISSFSAEQQRELAKRITTFLSMYKHLTDSFIIEFFSEDLWHSLPNSWQPVLQDLSYPQTADLLLSAHANKRYPSVWPLSLLAFQATAHALAFPRQCNGGGLLRRPKEFLENHSQSSLLGHIFRKHVKPKKQHEIRKLGMLVKQLCDQTGCRRVVDVGSGQGHLSRFLSFGLSLSVTAVEADHTLVAMASKFDEELVWTLEKEKQKKNNSSQLSMPYNFPKHVAAWVNPKESWESFIRQIKSSDCPTDGPMTPSQPSKKRMRGFDQQENSLGTPDCFDNRESSTAQEAELPSGNCSCTQANSDEGGSSEETRPEGCPDFLLTGLHACGDLSATLLHHFVNCPHVRGITSVACCYMKITTKENPTPPGLVTPHTPLTDDSFPSKFGYPMSSWVEGLQGHQLSYKAREGACHAMEDYERRLRDESQQLRSHCYRAMLETFIRDAKPDLRRAGIQTIRKSHSLTFTEYARLGLARVGLPPDLPLDPERVEAMLKQQRRVVVYFSLTMLLAPVVETLVLLDRMIYLQENGVDSQLVPLFNPNFSPRNFVLVAMKPSG